MMASNRVSAAGTASDGFEIIGVRRLEERVDEGREKVRFKSLTHARMDFKKVGAQGN
jgi:hypothetical protein